MLASQMSATAMKKYVLEAPRTSRHFALSFVILLAPSLVMTAKSHIHKIHPF